MKKARYFIEACLAYTLYGLFKILPLDSASATGGLIARSIGPRLGVTRKALRHLKRALPGKSDDEYNAIIRGMWDNLGRTIAEYPHLEKIGRERIQVENAEIVTAVRDTGDPLIIFTGHLANWETAPVNAYVNYNIAMDLVYRAPNNPYTRRLLDRARSLQGRLVTIPKSKTGARQIMQALRKNRYVGILIDQKYNEGINVPFFGYPAMTSPAFVQLAQKFKCPLIPVQPIRMKGAHFKIVVYPPLEIFDEKEGPLPAEDVICKAHDHLEHWIRENPEQWLWLHKRWREQDIDEAYIISDK